MWVQNWKFGMESPRHTLQALQKGDFLTSLDLRDAYQIPDVSSISATRAITFSTWSSHLFCL